MGAKDTELTGQAIGREFEKWQDTEDEVGTFEEWLRRVQAEISFKAGIREVVGFVEEHKKVTETELYIGKATYTHYDIRREHWQAKLEDWNIK